MSIMGWGQINRVLVNFHEFHIFVKIAANVEVSKHSSNCLQKVCFVFSLCQVSCMFVTNSPMSKEHFEAVT